MKISRLAVLDVTRYGQVGAVNATLMGQYATKNRRETTKRCIVDY
jgi:hypothetical protein